MYGRKKHKKNPFASQGKGEKLAMNIIFSDSLLRLYRDMQRREVVWSESCASRDVESVRPET